MYLFRHLIGARNSLFSVLKLSLLCTFFTSYDVALAQVAIDGSTATNVVVNADGSVTVGIAPSSGSGISINRYKKFNVPTAGVKLDNRKEAARTIVNEVTSNSTSRIQGDVEVLGQKSHVIIANPNGIVIDGGRFINTGRVALTTGEISINNRQIAPRIFQDNVVSTVTDGKITIKGGGLAGQMDAVDIIAHSIKVEGTVENSSQNENSSIRLAAGRSRTEFESSVLPGNTTLSWGTITGADAASPGSYLIEIERGGVLRGNRVAIEVNDQGAGVRFAGEGYASSREFNIRADGQVNLSSAKIVTKKDFITSSGSVQIDDSQLTSTEGDITLNAIDGTSSGISGSNFTLSGVNIFAVSQSQLTFGASGDSTNNLSASKGSIFIQSKDDLQATKTTMIAEENIIINGKALLAFSDSELTTAKGSIQLDADGALSVEGSKVSAFAHLLVTADEAEVSNTNTRSELKAENGSFILTTLGINSMGDLTNNGGLLQGGTKTDALENNVGTVSDGALTFDIKGTVSNITDDELAVMFGAGGDVSIKSGKDIKNNRGRIVANGDVNLITLGDVYNMVDAPNGAIEPEVVQYTRKGSRQWWTLWIKRKRESFVSYDYGVLDDQDKLAAITATKNVRIEAAGSLVNQGSQINANDGDIELKALRIETIGLGSGKVFVSKTCVVFCRYSGDGSVEYFGGTISASENIKIDALEVFSNKAGQVFAIKDVDIKAGNVELEAALVPNLVERPAGLYNFWATKAAWIFLRNQFGSIVADTGNISVISDNPVQIIGGTTVAGGQISLSNGETIVRHPENSSDALNTTIGLFSDVPLIVQD